MNRCFKYVNFDGQTHFGARDQQEEEHENAQVKLEAAEEEQEDSI